MGKKILDSKVLYVVLSVILSLAAWLYITSLDATRENVPFRNLPVELVDMDILEARGLMVVDENVTTTVNIRATPLVLATLRSTPPTLKASVSNLTTEGPHTVVYTIDLPDGVRQSDVEYVNTGNTVTVEVTRFLSREVPVKGDFQGRAADGYLAGDKDDFRFSPSTVRISGRAEDVNRVLEARVTVTGEDLTEAINENRPFQLIGASGDPLEGLSVSCDVDSVFTFFPVRATAEIPLEARAIEGGGLSGRDVTLTTSAKSIVVAGSREAVTALVNEGGLTFSIDLASLDDEVIENGGEQTFAIALPDELENLSGITEVKVSINVRKEVETRTFDVVSRISAINVPEGWEADIITQVLPVKVRGTRALLDELTEESIQVVANLQEINQAAGRYTMSASIHLFSTGTVADVGVVNPGSYTVVVYLKKGG